MNTNNQVPTDWHEFSLGDLLNFSNGINADKSAYGHGVPFANVLEVITHEALSADDIPGHVGIPQQVLSRYRVRRGDLLFNRTSETQDEVGLSSVYLDDAPIVFGGFVFRGRPTSCEMDVDFSKYALRSHAVRQQIIARGQGGIRANIGQRDLKSVRVQLPEHAEQRAIAAVLDDSSRLIRRLEQMIAKKQAIKQGVVQQLLTGRTRLPGFTKPWELRRLGDLLAYEQPGPYLVSSTEYSDVGTPVLTAGKTFVLGRTTEESGIYNAVPVIIFDDFTTASKLVTFPFKAKSSAMKILSPRLGVNLRYLFDRMQLINYIVVDHKRRWITEYSKIEVEVPDDVEQRAIASAVSDVDGEINALETRLAKACATKVGMMQELLTGRTRLPVQEVVS